MKHIRHYHFEGVMKLRDVKSRVFALVRTPFFWLITLWGNACVVGGALAFHTIEGGKNPAVQSFLDSLCWAVGIVTTVGVGNINPITPAGKVLLILMMMGGSVFLWSYMALFVGAFVAPELKSIHKDPD